jgi:hypothetical protein
LGLEVDLNNFWTFSGLLSIEQDYDERNQGIVLKLILAGKTWITGGCADRFDLNQIISEDAMRRFGKRIDLR